MDHFDFRFHQVKILCKQVKPLPKNPPSWANTWIVLKTFHAFRFKRNSMVFEIECIQSESHLNVRYSGKADMTLGFCEYDEGWSYFRTFFYLTFFSPDIRF